MRKSTHNGGVGGGEKEMHYSLIWLSGIAILFALSLVVGVAYGQGGEKKVFSHEHDGYVHHNHFELGYAELAEEMKSYDVGE